MTTFGIPFRNRQPAGNDYKVGSWVLRYYPPAAQHKLGSPWIGPHQVVRQATGHTVGIQRNAEKPMIFVHVDDLKLCPGPQDVSWVPNTPTPSPPNLSCRLWTHCHSTGCLAIWLQSSAPGRRQPRHSRHPSKSGRAPALRGRPCRPHSQLRLS